MTLLDAAKETLGRGNQRVDSATDPTQPTSCEWFPIPAKRHM